MSSEDSPIDKGIKFFAIVPIYAFAVSVLYNYAYFKAFGFQSFLFLTTIDHIVTALSFIISAFFDISFWIVLSWVLNWGEHVDGSKSKSFFWAILLLLIYAVIGYFLKGGVLAEEADIIAVKSENYRYFSLFFLIICAVLPFVVLKRGAFDFLNSLPVYIKVIIVALPISTMLTILNGYKNGLADLNYSSNIINVKTKTDLGSLNNVGVIRYLDKGILVRSVGSQANYFISWDNIEFIESK